jgi:predicted Zn-dependent protease
MIWALALLLAQSMLQDGARAMREKRFAEAERIYRQLLKVSPDDPRLWMNLGLALHSGGKYQEAVGELERYLKFDPKPGPIHLVQGVNLLKLSRPCEAVQPLETARKWQASPQVLAALGDGYYGCGRYGDAVRTLEAAAKDDDRARRMYARALWRAGEYARARAEYDVLAEKWADDPEFNYECGDTLARLEGAEAGLSYLEKAVRMAPALLPARGALGRALMELGKAAESIPHLELAAPADATLLMPLSRAYKATGRPEEAARVEAEYRRKVAAQN